MLLRTIYVIDRIVGAILKLWTFFWGDSSIINRENQYFLISPILQKFRIRRFEQYFLSSFDYQRIWSKRCGSRKERQAAASDTIKKEFSSQIFIFQGHMSISKFLTFITFECSFCLQLPLKTFLCTFWSWCGYEK